jgi:hypothetical protein
VLQALATCRHCNYLQGLVVARFEAESKADPILQWSPHSPTPTVHPQLAGLVRRCRACYHVRKRITHTVLSYGVRNVPSQWRVCVHVLWMLLAMILLSCSPVHVQAAGAESGLVYTVGGTSAAHGRRRVSSGGAFLRVSRRACMSGSMLHVLLNHAASLRSTFINKHAASTPLMTNSVRHCDSGVDTQ